jgi:pilus assembly protein CpaC
LIQNRVESENKGVPFLADLPWVGRAFSKVEERMNEVELLVIVTPELVAPLDSHQVPQCGPGQLNTTPSDEELYSYGYLEVPNCCLFAPPGYAELTTDAGSGAPAPSVPGETNAHAMPRASTSPVSSRNGASTLSRSPQTAVSGPEPVLVGPMGYDPLD